MGSITHNAHAPLNSGKIGANEWNANHDFTLTPADVGMTGTPMQVLFFDGSGNPAGDANNTFEPATNPTGTPFLHLTQGATAADAEAVLLGVGWGFPEHLVVTDASGNGAPGIMFAAQGHNIFGVGPVVGIASCGGTYTSPSAVSDGAQIGGVTFVPFIGAGYQLGTGPFGGGGLGAAGMIGGHVSGTDCVTTLFSDNGTTYGAISVVTGGHWVPGDWNGAHANAQDLGAVGNEWRTGYFGTSVVTPVISPAAGVNFTLPATNAAGVLTNDGAGNLSWV